MGVVPEVPMAVGGTGRNLPAGCEVIAPLAPLVVRPSLRCAAGIWDQLDVDSSVGEIRVGVPSEPVEHS